MALATAAKKMVLDNLGDLPLAFIGHVCAVLRLECFDIHKAFVKLHARVLGVARQLCVRFEELAKCAHVLRTHVLHVYAVAIASERQRGRVETEADMVLLRRWQSRILSDVCFPPFFPQ